MLSPSLPLAPDSAGHLGKTSVKCMTTHPEISTTTEEVIMQ
jgi:hypothetical protein